MLRRTPLHQVHRQMGARLVSFAGWEMPVQYRGIIEEHNAVRRRAGLFDVSHMGEIEVRGAGAGRLCQQIAVNDVHRLRDGEVQYSLLCNPQGGVIDDVTIYRLAEDRYLICVNASNTEKDFEWIRSQARGHAEVVNRSSDYAQMALQGPAATGILSACTGSDVSAVRAFRFLEIEVVGVPVLASRTGYTGEDGWEFYCDPALSSKLWGGLMEAGSAAGVVAAGLGARDTLRIERALPLYGHELTENITPLEAGLHWVVRFDTPFIGRDALRRRQAEGLHRRLVGLRLLEPGIPRQGYAILAGGQSVGAVTSGTRSPTLGKAIGLGYVTMRLASEGERLAVEIRQRAVAAEVVALPFYKRQSRRRSWNSPKI